MNNIELAIGLLRGYSAAKRNGVEGRRLKQVRNAAYVAAAFAAEAYIKAELKSGRPYVFYGDICQLLDTDRFTLAWILGKMQEINTIEKKPLWASFVTYKKPVLDWLQRVVFARGEPGGSYYSCAVDLGWEMKEGPGAFLASRRQQGLEALGLY